jgi:NFU1 iron-sulfur cluster scaffold homolog, mitochondrial
MLEIYQEATPNPDSLKFLFNKMLLPQEIIECKSIEESADSPLAKSLYEKFDWISNVFISNNFVTITKKSSNDWYEYMMETKEYLKMYVGHNFDIVTAAYLEKKIAERQAVENASDIDSKIKGLLEKYVKPAVEMDGGHIAFKSFENGKVTLQMQGSCSGCPSSQMTLKSGIEGLLKRMVPEVEEVVAEEL